MGSTEAVTRNLEVLSMQMHSQAEFARSGLETALAAIKHWQAVAASYCSDCVEAMQAKKSVETFRDAAAIFAGVLESCRHAERDAEAAIGSGR
jgi:hypothetical protein